MCGCICGGKSPDTFSMDDYICIGFGIAQVLKDGQPIYDEMDIERKHVAEKGEDTTDWPPFWTGQDAENAATADPDHDWHILIAGPLSGGDWKRTAPGVWSLVKDLGGFA